MRFSKVTAVAALSVVAEAQRPSNTTICDYYTTALFKNNTAANQYALLAALVNTVVIGNYSESKTGSAVPGILANGTGDYAGVNLLPYFDGGLASSNRGGNAVAVNFLDGGGADPLKQGKPANDMNSNQYRLLTHLYQFFGTALGCSQQSNSSSAFPSYQGTASQYQVHRFMALNEKQNGYFISQVAAAAASFGVATSDIQAVGTLLTNVFNKRCTPPTTVIPSAGPQLQSICIAESCPVSENATCASYAAVVQPGVANATLAQGQGNSSNPATSSAANGGAPTSSAAAGGATTSSSMGVGAQTVATGFGAAVLGFAALFL